MKILKLTAENIKKLRAVEITPTGELVEITGKNGAGKTSVLDAIWWALAGTKHIQAVPIRTGATKARIRLDLGELIVERRFTPVGSTLTVEKADGARYTSPQGILDALLGALTFDPLAFVGQEPREQFETLRRLVTLEVDVDQLDALNRGDFDRRTEINRDAKTKRAQADGIAVRAGVPEAAIDTAALKDAMGAAAAHNADLEARKGRRAAAAQNIVTGRDAATAKRMERDRFRHLADELDRAAVDLEANTDALQARLDAAPALPDPVDVAAPRTALYSAEEINGQVERRQRQAALVAEAEQLEGQARALTETMEARERTKAEAIAKAPMPVPGLGFGEGLVTFDGVPFDQAETSAQIRVGVAIAMAANPKLRVIRIKEGSFLDQDNLALIAEMARAHDYQVWIERVDTSGKVGIVIEDGTVVAVDGQPVDA